ncbi:MAG: roadblock/LC7 domain-containing protein [Chloroflexota bacterium]
MSEKIQQKDNSQRLQDTLDELIARNPHILIALVVSDEGLNVGSGLPHHDDDSLALIASDLVDAAQKFSHRLDQGLVDRILLEGEQRTTIIMKSGARTVLAVVTPADVKLGLITLSMRQAADQIEAIFK